MKIGSELLTTEISCFIFVTPHSSGSDVNETKPPQSLERATRRLTFPGRVCTEHCESDWRFPFVSHLTSCPSRWALSGQHGKGRKSHIPFIEGQIVQCQSTLLLEPATCTRVRSGFSRTGPYSYSLYLLQEVNLHRKLSSVPHACNRLACINSTCEHQHCTKSFDSLGTRRLS